jgi:hypothetical protein
MNHMQRQKERGDKKRKESLRFAINNEQEEIMQEKVNCMDLALNTAELKNVEFNDIVVLRSL